MRPLLFLALLLAAVPACASPGGEGDAADPPSQPAPADPLLAAAAEPDAAGHEEALESWEDLPWEEQVPRLIAGLRSADPATALFCAKALPPECLSLEEIRIQCAILVEHPGEVLRRPVCEGMRSLGSPDLLPLLRAAVARGVEGEEGDVRDLHRVTIPDHLPGLVALLEPAEGETFHHLLWMVNLLADNTDRHRDEVARGLLFVRGSFLASVEGRAPPRLADFLWARADGVAAATLEETAAPGGPLEGYDLPLPRCWLARVRGEAEPPGDDGVPAAFSPAEARERIAALRAAGPPPEEDDGAWGRIEREAPLLEAAAPDAMEGLLEAWKDAPAGVGEGWVAESLGRLRAAPGWRFREQGPEDGRSPADRLREAADGDPGPVAIARLGLLGEVALPVLRRIRDDRSRGDYWPATAGLAVAGDAAARSEFLAFLAEDRTFVLDNLWGDGVALGLNGDPDALAHWRSRVGSNCCLWGCAAGLLQDWYPTMPCEVRIGDFDATAARAAAWWERWRDRLRWSRLADGWVPVAPE